MEENAQIAAQLREAAALVEAQGGNPFRVGAYRKAADTILRKARPGVAMLLEVDREYRDQEPECRAHYALTTEGEHA